MGVETLMMAAAAASAAGAAANGLNAYQMGRYNAAVLRTQGEQARRDAGSETQLQLEKGARAVGSGIVAAAKSGGGGDGSALSVLQDLSRQSMYEARRTATEGVAAGAAYDAQAKAEKRQGKVALAGGLFEAGATLLGGAIASKQAAAARTAQRQASAMASAPAGFSLQGLY